MAIEDEFDEVSDLPSYDELFKAFTELHDNSKKIGMKNTSLTNKNVELSNKNDSLNEKIKCLELENERPHGAVVCFKEKENVSSRHESLLVNDLKKENEMFRKKNNKINDFVLKFTNGQKKLDKLLSSQKCVFDKGGNDYKPNLKQKY